MLGYTKGVAENIYKQSQDLGIGNKFFKFENDVEEIWEELSDEIDIYNTDELKEFGIAFTDSYNVYLEDKGVLAVANALYLIDDLSQGGLEYYIKDNEIVGMWLGVAGEHLGQVSVWIDTFKGTVNDTDGNTFKLTDEDIDRINEFYSEYLDENEIFTGVNTFIDLGGNEELLEEYDLDIA